MCQKNSWGYIRPKNDTLKIERYHRNRHNKTKSKIRKKNRKYLKKEI